MNTAQLIVPGEDASATLRIAVAASSRGSRVSPGSTPGQTSAPSSTGAADRKSTR